MLDNYSVNGTDVFLDKIPVHLILKGVIFMKKLFCKTLAMVLSLAVIFSCIVTSAVFTTSADNSAEAAPAVSALSDDVEITRKTYTFDTMDGIFLPASNVEVKDGALLLNTDGKNWWHQVGFDFPLCNGKTYGVSLVYKIAGDGKQSPRVIRAYGSNSGTTDQISKTGWLNWSATDYTNYATTFTVEEGTLKNDVERYFWLILDTDPTGNDIYLDSLTIYEVGADSTIEFNTQSEITGKNYAVASDGNIAFSTDWKGDVGLTYVLSPSTEYNYEIKCRASSGTLGSNFKFFEGAAGWLKGDTISNLGWINVTDTKVLTGTFTSSANAGSGEYAYLWLRSNTDLTDNQLIVDSVRIYQAGGTVAFNTLTDDISVDSITGGYRQVVTLPEPVRYGYNFEGWYYDEALTNKAESFVNIPAAEETKTLYAKWSEAEEVVFDFSNSSDLKAGEGGTSITDGQLKMTNKAGSQARALLPYAPKAGKSYSISFKYRSEHELTETATSGSIQLQLNLGRDTTAWSMFRGDENLETKQIAEGGTKLGNLTSPKSSDNGEWLQQTFVFTMPDEYPTKVKDETTTYVYKYLGLRIQPYTVKGTLYIDDIVIKEATEFDFSSASQVGNAYSAEIVDETLKMYAKAKSQSRARLLCNIENDRVYKIAFRYRTDVDATYDLRGYASKASTTYGNWAIFGGDNEASQRIASIFYEKIDASEEWATAEVVINPQCVTEEYKYLGFWMQPANDDTTVVCNLYIDDVSVTEMGGAVTLNYNDSATAEENLIGYNVGDVIELPAPARDGYNFEGWYSDAALTKAVGESFTVTEENVTLYAKWVQKVAAQTPAAPEIAAHTQDSVTLTAVDGYEYSMNGTDWQSSPVFSGLLTGAEYSFYQRVAETQTAFASAASEATVYKIVAHGDANGDGELDADDLTTLKKVLLGVETEYETDGANSNGDEVIDIIDLINLKKKVAAQAATSVYTAIDNVDITVFSINNSLNSMIGNEIEDTFVSAVKTRTDKDFAVSSENVIEISLDETLEDDTYRVYVKNGNMHITAASEYALLEAVQVLSERIVAYPKDRALNLQDGYTFAGKFAGLKTDGKYSLVWNDEFNGTALDSSKWSVNKWTESDTWIDRQNNTDGSTLEYTDKYITVSDGAAHLGSVTVDNGNGTYSFYGSDIRTNKKMTFAHGYFEARIKLPGGAGQWSAFWANGFRDSASVNINDYSTEIDVMENFGYTNKYQTDLHVWGNSTVDGLLNQETDQYGNLKYHKDMLSKVNVESETLASEFHIYGCEWTETALKLYFDGNCYYEIDFADFADGYVNETATAEHFANLINGDELQLLLTTGAASGHYENYSDATVGDENYIYDTEMTVDYVRIYQLGGKENLKYK